MTHLYPLDSEKQNTLLEDFLDEMIKQHATPLPSHIRSVLRDLCRYTPILPIGSYPVLSGSSIVVKLTSCLAIGRRWNQADSKYLSNR